MAGIAIFLAARMTEVDVGLQAQSVRRVVSPDDWDESEPLDLEELLFRAPGQKACRHILVFDSGQAARALCTSRELVLRECEPGEIHDLPPLIWDGSASPLVESVVNRADALPLLILSRRALATILPPED